MSVARPKSLGIPSHRSTVLDAVRRLCAAPSSRGVVAADVAADTGLSETCVRSHLVRLAASGTLTTSRGQSRRATGAGRQPVLYAPARRGEAGR